MQHLMLAEGLHNDSLQFHICYLDIFILMNMAPYKTFGIFRT